MEQRPEETGKELLVRAITRMRGNGVNEERIIALVAQVMAETLPERN